jgi:Domain of unknown function (DUF222)/HNH endonuclease
MRAGDLLDRLRADLTELATVDPATLSEPALLDTLRALHPQICQAQAVQTRLIAAAHRRGAAAGDGAASTQAWLRCRLRLGDAGTQIRVATALDRLPHVHQAYQRGDLSYAHAAAITDTARDIHPDVLAASADKLLAEQASTLTPAATRRAAVRVRDHFDPDAAARRTARLYADRWLTVDRTIHGAVSIQGVLDPDGGHLLLTTLAAFTPSAAPEDPRSPGARRADALVQMCRAAGTAAPQQGGEKPHLVVTLDWPTLRDELSHTLHTASGRWAGATLTTGTPIHPTTARRLACDATLIPAILGTAGEPLDIGRATRVVPSGMRRALTLRDGGCRFPTCDRPSTWCDAHHLQPWAHGGPTRLSNMVLLCRHHHVAVHEGGWTITLDPTTNTITTHHPDGTPHDLTTRPRAQSP